MSIKDALQSRGSPKFLPKIRRLVWLIVHYVTICKKLEECVFVCVRVCALWLGDGEMCRELDSL